jgi:hypothetical protein
MLHLQGHCAPRARADPNDTCSIFSSSGRAHLLAKQPDGVDGIRGGEVGAESRGQRRIVERPSADDDGRSMDA